METTTTNFTKQIIDQVISSWASRNIAVTKFFNLHDDEAVYLQEVAPGRNRAIYLLGHLISSNDGMLPMFGLGERLFPELEAPFSLSPDKASEDLPAIPDLKKRWEKLNTTLTEKFNSMTVEEWMDRHSAVSPEDFAKEPHRNKLNVLIGRTNHQSYHLGQMNLLTVKELVA